MKHSYLLLKDRFGTEEMRNIWEERNWVQKWLDFEKAITLSQAELGIVPNEAAKEIASKSTVQNLTPKMINEFKSGKATHLIVSFVKAFAEICGTAGEYYHLGPTTQSILDTGLTLQIKEAHGVIMRQLFQLEEILLTLANKHKKTVMMGRTHGQHAAPLTFGFKVAIWAGEFRDHIERFREMEKRLFIIKLSGIVGSRNSFAYLLGSDNVQKFVEMVADRIGLGIPKIMDAGQRLDRFAELCFNLAMVISTLGKIGSEIMDLQRTEVGEVEEPRDDQKQYSSSTLPSKRNPSSSQWLEGLAKIARANAQAMMDLRVQHERDITHLAVEFSCIPDNFLYAASSLDNAIRIFEGLVINEDKMKENLYIQKGLAMSEALMLCLFKKTGKKVSAHTLLHDISAKAFADKVPMREALLKDSEIKKHLTPEELDEIINPEAYIGDAPTQVDALIKYIRAKRKEDLKTKDNFVR